jgi:hypothetical protein
MTDSNLMPDILIDEAIRFVRQRNRLMERFGAWRTPRRLRIVSRLLRELDFARSYSLENKCRLIIRLIPDMQDIAAGRSSRYFNGEQKKLQRLGTKANELLQECFSVHP